eukprot:970202_1
MAKLREAHKAEQTKLLAAHASEIVTFKEELSAAQSETLGEREIRALAQVDQAEREKEAVTRLKMAEATFESEMAKLRDAHTAEHTKLLAAHASELSAAQSEARREREMRALAEVDQTKREKEAVAKLDRAESTLKNTTSNEKRPLSIDPETEKPAKRQRC